MPLTDVENVVMGTICGTADVCLLQPTNYWKNASQQGLPFSLKPSVLYRGIGANILNNGFCVGSQFFLNVANNKNLDWFTPGESKHPVFGKLRTKADYELAVKISKVRTRDDNPIEPIKMISVTVRNLKTARAAEAAADEAESPTKKLKSPEGAPEV